MWVVAILVNVDVAQKRGNVLSRLFPGSLQSSFQNFYVCCVILAENLHQKVKIILLIFRKC